MVSTRLPHFRPFFSYHIVPPPPVFPWVPFRSIGPMRTIEWFPVLPSAGASDTPTRSPFPYAEKSDLHFLFATPFLSNQYYEIQNFRLPRKTSPSSFGTTCLVTLPAQTGFCRTCRNPFSLFLSSLISLLFTEFFLSISYPAPFSFQRSFFRARTVPSLAL